MGTSTVMQKALCAVGTASIFLPWMQINLFFTTVSANLLTFMLGGAMMKFNIIMMLGSALFLAGSIALLWWKKAPLIQIAGLTVLTAGIVGFMMPDGTGLESIVPTFQALLGITGIGVYVGWGAAIGGLVMMWLGWPTPEIVQNALRHIPFKPRARKVAVPATSTRELTPEVQARVTSVHQTSFPIAMETAEKHLESGDLSSALAWYGKALGTSRNDEERAISKVRIASVLHSLGNDHESRQFIQEARQIDPEDISGWSIPLEDWNHIATPRARGAEAEA